MYLLSQLSFDLHYNHCYIYLSIYILCYFLPRLQHISEAKELIKPCCIIISQVNKI